MLCAQVMRSKNLPGAGQYNTYKAVGKQPLSNKKTLPAHSFGKSTRDASKKSEHVCGLQNRLLWHGACPDIPEKG
jgi:hypothetical protein